MSVRPSALAGRWYAGAPAQLRRDLLTYLEASPKKKCDGIRAIIVPHAGYVWSGPTAAVAFNALNVEKIRRIFIFCPNHRVPVRGAVSVSAEAFETPLGRVPVDRNLVESWHRAGLLQIDDGAHRLEHAIEIQLPFLQVIFGDRTPTIVPVIVGQVSTDELKRMAHRLQLDLKPQDLVLISSDFLHYGEDYGFVPFGAPVQPQIDDYDHRTLKAIQTMNAVKFEEFARANPHAACGIHALRLLEWVFQGDELEAYELAYDTSGRRSGEDDMSVSYFAIAIAPKSQDLHDMNALDKPVSSAAQKTAHDLVKRALTEAVTAQKSTPFPKDLDRGSDPDVFSREYGVFVTLNEADGHLRGCIGNIVPVDRLAESLWARAQDAALHDPRFAPVTIEELPSLDVEISVLTPIRPVSGPQDIVVGKHGVFLKKSGRSAVFLPQVAPEQGWNLDQMLTALSRKAGLPPQAWREDAAFSVFEAQVF